MKKTLKGFTLIELIVVLAIFGIVLASAMNLMTPVHKLMINANTAESGSAATASMGNYLKNELGMAEYLTVLTDCPINHDASDPFKDTVDNTKVLNYALDFAKSHYRGIIRNYNGNDPNPASTVYASGIVHVMIIDNVRGGRITNVACRCTFDPTNMTAVRITPVDESDATKAKTVVTGADLYAVNRAFYDVYDYDIVLGNYENEAQYLAERAAHLTPENVFNTSMDYTTFLNNVNSKNTTFTIFAHNNNASVGNRNYLGHATVPLVNIMNRGTIVPRERYYTNSQITITKPDHTTEVQYIFQDAADDTHINTNNAIYHPDTSLVPQDGNGYCFIYSYGSEIDTSKP